MVGCNNGDRDISPKPAQSAQSEPPAAPPDAKSGGQQAAADEPLDIKPVKVAQAAYDAAKKAFAAAPKDDKAKKAYLETTNTLADSTMQDATLANSVKYPGALKLYRQVVKTDPTNKHANYWINMIKSIYAQLGKPVPGGG